MNDERTERSDSLSSADVHRLIEIMNKNWASSTSSSRLPRGRSWSHALSVGIGVLVGAAIGIAIGLALAAGSGGLP